MEKQEPLSMPDSERENSQKSDGALEENAGFGSYIRVFSYADAFGWFLNILAFICAIGAGAILPLMDLVFGKTVTTFNSFAIGQISPAEFRLQATKWTLYFLYLFAAKFVLTYIWSFALNFSALRTTKALRIDFLRSVLRQDIGYFDQTGVAAVSVQVTTNCNLVNTGISEKLGLLVQGISTFFTAFIVAFTVQWKLTFITLGIVPAILIVTTICIILDTSIEGKMLSIYARAGQLAEDVISSIKTVHSFWAHPKLFQRYDSLLREAKIYGNKKSAVYGVLFSTEFFCVFAGYGLCFWQGVRMYSGGQFSQPGSIVTVIFAVVVAATALTAIAPQILHLTKAAGAANGLYAIIDRKSEIDSFNDEGRKPDRCTGMVELRDLEFSYPSRPNVTVLDKINLVIPANKTTAFVGASGCGKSTIVGLIERWYNPTGGEIMLDDCNIRDYSIQWLRANIRMVQQEPVLFSGTVFQNVSYGLVGTQFEKSPDDEKLKLVQEACKSAYAHEFIEELPEGYHTDVGERAGRLSGGQKQRICIARAIISSPKVLLLDEATSALDPKAEHEVQAALDNVSADRTTVTIAHKLSTVLKAHNIVIMSKGAIIEQGTHEQLMKIPNGAYFRLVKAQDLGEDSDQETADVEKGSRIDKMIRTEKTKTNETTRHANDTEQLEKLDYNLLKIIWIIICEQKTLWPQLIIILLTCIVGGLAPPAIAILFARIMVVFQLPADQMVNRGDFYSLMFFVIAIAVFVVYFVLGVYTNRVSQSLTLYYRGQMFTDLTRQDMSFFDKSENATGALVSRLSSQPTQLQELLSFNVGIILIGIVTVISGSILAIAYGWKLGLVVVFGALPPMVYAGYLRIRLEFKLDDQIDETFGNSAALASEAVSAIRTVASLALERSVLERYQESLAKIELHSVKALTWTMFWLGITHSINFLAMALGFWYGSRLLSTGEYSTTQFFTVFMAVLLSGESAAQFFMYTTSLTKAQGAANYMMWLHGLEPTIREHVYRDDQRDENDSDTFKDSTQAADVECKDLVFSYPGRPGYTVLRGISAEAKSGQSIAFVGPSGCGKSTVISLLERFYDPLAGRITFNSQDIKSLCPRKYRSNVSIVQQEPTLYQLSIRENVALGANEDATEGEIDDACKRANIYDFITSLPEGFNTLCGNRGTQLSGGQRQRVCLARALVRKPRLLLLDEATSALDSESEKIVQQALDNEREGCTTIAVAHRLSTIKNSDCILVFSRGKIVERGTHNELLAKKGVYFEMCQGQGLEQGV